MISENTKREILFRLKLAQDILEDSDRLGGVFHYPNSKEEWWKHPRHTRESLAIYLLLTCFDKLGQPDEFILFENWLKSTKKIHQTEVKAALESLPPEIDIIASTIKLSEHHQAIYGVKKSFHKGIDSIPEPFKTSLLSSISICTKPDFGKTPPNVSTPGVEITDHNEVNKLRYKYLYRKRNDFTHNLEQHHRSSVPMMAGAQNTGDAAWVAQIRDSKLHYLGLHQEYEPKASVGAYCYSISNWPFILFEAIYAAIGISFHKTEINLKFQVLLFNSRRHEGKLGRMDNVDHVQLKNYHQLENDYWKNL